MLKHGPYYVVTTVEDEQVQDIAWGEAGCKDRNGVPQIGGLRLALKRGTTVQVRNVARDEGPAPNVPRI